MSYISGMPAAARGEFARPDHSWNCA